VNTWLFGNEPETQLDSALTEVSKRNKGKQTTTNKIQLFAANEH
jgi:hypothetical protein